MACTKVISWRKWKRTPITETATANDPVVRPTTVRWVNVELNWYYRFWGMNYKFVSLNFHFSSHRDVNAQTLIWIRKVRRAKIANQRRRYNGITQIFICHRWRENHRVMCECITHVIVHMLDKGHYFAKKKQNKPIQCTHSQNSNQPFLI